MSVITKEFQTYNSFRKYFHNLCEEFVSRYLPSEYLYNSIRKQTTDEYLNSHSGAKRDENSMLKALNLKKEEYLLSIPEDLRSIAKRLVHRHYSKGGTFGNQALKDLYDYCTEVSLPSVSTLHFLAGYYIVATDIVNIRYWHKQAVKQLHGYEVFKESCSSFCIVSWYEALKPVVHKIRFKNEWFAVYFAIRKYLRPRHAHTFCRIMNEWYPDVSVKCTYDSIADYNFLLENDGINMKTKLEGIKTKATLNGCLRIYNLQDEILSIQFVPYRQYLIK